MVEIIYRHSRHPETQVEIVRKRSIEKELIQTFQQNCSELRYEGIKNIAKIQEENRRTSHRKRKAAKLKKLGGLVAIRRTLSGPTIKLRPGFLGPCKIVYCIQLFFCMWIFSISNRKNLFKN